MCPFLISLSMLTVTSLRVFHTYVKEQVITVLVYLCFLLTEVLNHWNFFDERVQAVRDSFVNWQSYLQ